MSGNRTIVKYSFSMSHLVDIVSNIGNSPATRGHDFQGFTFNFQEIRNKGIRISLLSLILSPNKKLREDEDPIPAEVEQGYVPISNALYRKYKFIKNGETFYLKRAFLSKIQFDWFKELIGGAGKLYLADAYVDFGKTPSWMDYSNNSSKFLTLKAWVEPESINNNALILPDTSLDNKGGMPTIAILPPCPPIWPPFLITPGDTIEPLNSSRD